MEKMGFIGLLRPPYSTTIRLMKTKLRTNTWKKKTCKGVAILIY